MSRGLYDNGKSPVRRPVPRTIHYVGPSRLPLRRMGIPVQEVPLQRVGILVPLRRGGTWYTITLQRRVGIPYPCEGWVYHTVPLRRVGIIPLRRALYLLTPRRNYYCTVNRQYQQLVVQLGHFSTSQLGTVNTYLN